MTFASYTVGQETNGNLSQGMQIEQPLTAAASIQVQNNAAPMSYDVSTNKISEHGYSSTNAGEGVTVTSESGSPRAFASKGSDLVKYHGMDVQASTLERMGVMSFDKTTDRYAMNAEQPQQQAQPQEQAELTATGDSHDKFQMSESENNEVNACLPESLTSQPAVMQGITNRAIESLVSGDLSSTIKSFSQSTGQSPAEATASVGKAMQAFSTAADKYLGKTVGLPQSDIPAFYAWARANAASDLKLAANDIVSKNSFRSLGKMVGAWSQATPPSINALEAAGYKVTNGSDGKATIMINGRQISVAAASKARLI